jgi:hypothetical protein
LLELKFDLTRLKSICLGGKPHIFERARVNQLSAIREKNAIFETIERGGLRIPGVQVVTMPVLMTIRERSTIYILREQVGGIHAEEALAMLKQPRLRKLDREHGLSAEIASLMKCVKEELAHSGGESQAETYTVFVPWYNEYNYPRFVTSDPALSLYRKPAPPGNLPAKSMFRNIGRIFLA